MTTGLLAALGAAVLYGVATVLQASAARQAEPGVGIDVGLIFRLLGRLVFVAGLAVDVAGFGLSLVALRTLPLFAVQSAVASSIAVTALLEAAVLRVRVTARQRLPLLSIGVGLVLLAASAAPDRPAPVAITGRLLLGVGVVVVAVAAVALRRTGSGDAAAARFGAAAGLGFAGTALCARVLVVPHPVTGLLRDPVLWELVVYGALGMILLTTALQRGSATATTAASFAVETIVPAAIGLVFLNDRAREGLWPAAAAGFALAVIGSVLLALRHPAEAGQIDTARASARSL